MKETTVQRIKKIKQFYKDIFKNTIILFLISIGIIALVSTWRFNIFIYFLGFLISFSIAFIHCFTQKESRREFIEGDV